MERAGCGLMIAVLVWMLFACGQPPPESDRAIVSTAVIPQERVLTPSPSASADEVARAGASSSAESPAVVPIATGTPLACIQPSDYHQDHPCYEPQPTPWPDLPGGLYAIYPLEGEVTCPEAPVAAWADRNDWAEPERDVDLRNYRLAVNGEDVSRWSAQALHSYYVEVGYVPPLPLALGTHEATVYYEDRTGTAYEFSWRFQVRAVHCPYEEWISEIHPPDKLTSTHLAWLDRLVNEPALCPTPEVRLYLHLSHSEIRAGIEAGEISLQLDAMPVTERARYVGARDRPWEDGYLAYRPLRPLSTGAHTLALEYIDDEEGVGSRHARARTFVVRDMPCRDPYVTPEPLATAAEDEDAFWTRYRMEHAIGN